MQPIRALIRNGLLQLDRRRVESILKRNKLTLGSVFFAQMDDNGALYVQLDRAHQCRVLQLQESLK